MLLLLLLLLLFLDLLRGQAIGRRVCGDGWWSSRDGRRWGHDIGGREGGDGSSKRAVEVVGIGVLVVVVCFVLVCFARFRLGWLVVAGGKGRKGHRRVGYVCVRRKGERRGRKRRKGSVKGRGC